MGSFGFSLRALSDFSLVSGCTEAFAGHSNNDFASMGLPSYQHFCPSMRRQDQYPCEFDGTAALHCCFACAVGIPSDAIVARPAAKAIDRNCFVIEHLLSKHYIEAQRKDGSYRRTVSFSILVTVGRKLGQNPGIFGG
jgi:hypothetical protein